MKVKHDLKKRLMLGIESPGKFTIHVLFVRQHFYCKLYQKQKLPVLENFEDSRKLIQFGGWSLSWGRCIEMHWIIWNHFWSSESLISDINEYRQCQSYRNSTRKSKKMQNASLTLFLHVTQCNYGVDRDFQKYTRVTDHFSKYIDR